MASHIPLMDWTGEDLAENFLLYKEKIQLYFEDEGIHDDAMKARKILRSVGDQGLKMLHGSGLSDSEKKKEGKLWGFLEEQLPSNKVNFRIARLQLMRLTMGPEETIDTFVTRARKLGAKSKLTAGELHTRIIELVISSTPNDDFCKELLGQPETYTLKKLLEDGRKHEAIAEGKAQMLKLAPINKEADEVEVDAFKSRPERKKCGYCDRIHKPKSCPAYNSTCKACGKKGHWEVVCRSRKQDATEPKSHSKRRQDGRRKTNRSRMDEFQDENESDDEASQFDSFIVDSVEKGNGRKEATITLPVKPQNATGLKKATIKLKIDTGASGNTVPMRIVRAMYKNDRRKINENLTQERIRLTAYNGKSIRYYGTTYMRLYKNGKWHNIKFYAIDTENYRAPAILGLKSCEDLQIVTIHNTDSIAESQPVNTIGDLKAKFPQQFDTIGCFDGEVTLHLKDDAKPFIAAPRKCSIHMKARIKAELDDMENKSIIRRVDEHSDWCSNVCFVTKKDNSLRVCLDPKQLNENLKRCPHKIPTLEELNPMFDGAKYFSKLDAKAGYWSCKLAEESQLLTTFRSPLGQRYCFIRMPFGLNTAQDDFQRNMDEILENLQGVVGIADDVCVTGRTEEDHDQNLMNLMLRAQEKGLVFNSAKCDIKKKTISFFGNIYTEEGIKPDPAKVNDIANMPSPTNKDELRRFLGMITYLNQFIPKFSDKSSLLRDLLKEDTPWLWEESHEKAYSKLKETLSEESKLNYFSTEKDVTLEVDASQRGLGTAIIQDGKPVAFGSKALTDTQSRYSNIEREMLAIVFGCERHHTLLYGKSFTVVTDHKPLVTICKKSIHAIPARLQRMQLRLQFYDFNIIYRPGSQMILADALSRLPNPENKGDIDLDHRVDSADIEIDTVDLRNICLINFSDQKQSDLLVETTRDPILNQLKEIICNGWPENIKGLPTALRQYWAYRDELAVEGGILFKGRQVLIPATLHQDILKTLHKSHQGIEKTRQLARESCYWPNISKDIENTCKSCDLCQEHQHHNKREPMIPHEVPSRKWQLIASDLFEIAGRHFLIISDKFSKFPLVDELKSLSSQAVTEKFRHYCAIFGKPQCVYSDNGPQYTGPAFKEFCNNWGIKHITSSPTHSRSNGFIERQVGHVKPLLEKSIRDKQDLYLTLLNIRATPINPKLGSPAELLLGDPIATLLPSRMVISREEVRDEQYRIQDQMVERDITNTKKTVLPPLLPGQHVRFLSPKNNRWYPGTIIAIHSAPRSYVIQSNGRTIRRNRGDIRPITPPRATTANRAPHATDTPTNNNRGAPQADPKPAANGDGGGRTGPTRSGRTPKPNPKYS